MTEIPSHLPASAAQAGIQAGEVAKERDARRTGQTDAARRQINSINEADSTVDTEDGDVAIFTDAEGTGSQGRESTNEDEEALEEEPKIEGKEDTGTSADGTPHIDLEA